MKVVLEMLFLIFSNVDISFIERELVWKIYSAVKALPMTQRVEIINKKEFAVVTLNKKDKTFVVYMTALSIVDSNVYLFRQA